MMYVVYVDWNEREREIRNYTSFVYRCKSRIFNRRTSNAAAKKKKKTHGERKSTKRKIAKNATDRKTVVRQPSTLFSNLLGSWKHTHTTDRQTDRQTHIHTHSTHGGGGWGCWRRRRLPRCGCGTKSASRPTALAWGFLAIAGVVRQGSPHGQVPHTGMVCSV